MKTSALLNMRTGAEVARNFLRCSSSEPKGTGATGALQTGAELAQKRIAKSGYAMAPVTAHKLWADNRTTRAWQARRSAEVAHIRPYALAVGLAA